MRCDRCGDEVDRIHPLDAVTHRYGASEVCDDCVKPTDEVVDL